MIKKFLFVLSLIILPLMPVKAEPIAFSHASIIMGCSNLDSILIVFEAAQKNKPVRNMTLVDCFGVDNFGAPVNSKVQSNIRQISSTVKDWEGDQFAVFEYISPWDGKTVYLIVYNPNDLKSGQLVN